MTNTEKALARIEEFAPDIVRAEEAIKQLSDILELLEEKDISYGEEFDEVLEQAMEAVYAVRSCELFLSPDFDAPVLWKEDIAQCNFHPRSMEDTIHNILGAIRVCMAAHPEAMEADDGD